MRAIPFPKAALAFLGGLGSLAPADRADAGQYSCQVPLAVLCPGCATNVTITLQPRGSCRVSFSPATGGASPPPSGAVTLQIETPAPQGRRGVFSRARHAGRLLQTSGRPCFTFNGNQYCE